MPSCIFHKIIILQPHDTLSTATAGEGRDDDSKPLGSGSPLKKCCHCYLLEVLSMGMVTSDSDSDSSGII